MGSHNTILTSRLYVHFHCLQATLWHATTSVAEIKVEARRTDQDHETCSSSETTHCNRFVCRTRKTHFCVYIESDNNERKIER